MTTTEDMIVRQQPLATAFGYRTTATEVLSSSDLASKTAIVTGGYSGLGIETVKALTVAGAAVIVPARRPDAARAALAGLAGVTVTAMDLGDLDSVAAFSQSVREDGTAIDIMINVAGVMASPYSLTPQGWESQFGVNYLGHFALVAGVAELLSDGARVVSYSSTGHYLSPVNFDDINFEHTPYDPWIAYGQSKTADALFAVALDARAASHGVHAFSVHPGGIMTELQRHMSREELIKRQWVDADGKPNEMFKTPAQGAATALWAATAPQLVDRGGVYCEDCSILGLAAQAQGSLATGGVKKWAIDMDAADRLFALSVKATGLNPFAD
ncbi:oxidoreductase [Arthrobacter cryoconiti]|uniref:Oxidoreductase n=1 Tax=Arthrobacter cryoconiti TaxID=748907 RepID=A0ABV8QXW5_9MICC|nr:oxidoreductase [Arthrobacter cryoconiti]MCC9068181.1 SDR family NAD(P)-dependent oxidoreductase [Arthrobacter cryoconiti]